MCGFLSDAEKTLSGLNKQQKVLQSDLETCKAEEQEIQDKINEDAKDLEKISTKLSTLLKKVHKNCLKSQVKNFQVKTLTTEQKTLL